MDVHAAIETRRSYRSLAPFPVDEELVRDLARHAQLAPSCANNQPWRYVFVYDPAALTAMRPVFSRANEWCHAASMIIAVFSRKEDDCLREGREYHQFDTGMATAFLILRATELGLVAHPIAGYDAAKTREILGIPDVYQVITLVLVGKHASEISPVLTPKQAAIEGERPERLPQEKFVFLNRYSG
ncbi:MAG: nitroreductase family protein [Candidatus Aminicenantales bacterium]